MKTKILSVLLSLVLLLSFSFAEYRFIMNNIQPYIHEDGRTVYLVLFGVCDTYYSETLYIEE